jgi:hypothetical protein
MQQRSGAVHAACIALACSSLVGHSNFSIGLNTGGVNLELIIICFLLNAFVAFAVVYILYVAVTWSHNCRA